MQSLTSVYLFSPQNIFEVLEMFGQTLLLFKIEKLTFLPQIFSVEVGKVQLLLIHLEFIDIKSKSSNSGSDGDCCCLHSFSFFFFFLI